MRWLYGLLMLMTLGYANHGLSLEQALALLKEKNLEVSIHALDEEIASLDARMAQAQSWGELALTQTALRSNDALSVFGFKLQSREATFGDFGVSEFNPLNPNVLKVAPKDLNYPDARNHFQTALEYTVPLYTGGKLQAYEDITKALHALKRLETQERLVQQGYEVKKSFHAISLLHQHHLHLKILLDTIEKMQTLTQAMYEEGYAKPLDLLEIAVRKSDVERLLHQSQTRMTLLYHYLSFLLQTPVESIVFVAAEVPFEVEDMLPAVEDNLMVQKAHKGVEIASHAVTLTQSAFLPQIGAFAQYGSSDNRVFNDGDKESYTIGLQMRWSLFKGGADFNAFEKSRVEHLKAQQSLLLAQEATRLRWHTVRTEIMNATYEIERMRKELVLAETIYEHYVQRYQEKLVSIHEVLLKHSDQITKQMQLLELQHKRNEKIFEYHTLHYKEAL